MASKYINNGSYATSGYTLRGVFQTITIGTEGTIGGPGLLGGTKEAYTIENHGRVVSTTIAVSLLDGGLVTNSGTGALISGASGLLIKGAVGSAENAGLIEATLEGGFFGSSRATHGIGVRLSSGGSVTNEVGGTIEATGSYGIGIELGAEGTVANSGEIAAFRIGSIGISLASNGSVTNGNDAVIKGYTAGILVDGYSASVGTIENGGTILSTGTRSSAIELQFGGRVQNISGGYIRGIYGQRPVTITNAGIIAGGSGPQLRYGIFLRDDGTVNNGAKSIIDGISIAYGGGTIVNAGTIVSTMSYTMGIVLSGGIVTNAGSASLIEGYARGVFGATTLTNDGTIEATSTKRAFELPDYGIGVEASFILNNNAGGLIGGYNIGIEEGGRSYIRNSGTIQANGVYGLGIEFGEGVINNFAGASIKGYGGIFDTEIGTVVNAGSISGGGIDLYLREGGVLLNGPGASIEGGTGVVAGYGTATVDNAGTITTSQNGGGDGVDLQSGGILTNKSSGSIVGYEAVVFRSHGTLINAGKLQSLAGPSGRAVDFESDGDVLIDEAGATFIGEVMGGNGTLELTGSPGILRGLGSTFSGFAAVEVLAGASWTLAGTNVVASGITSNLIDSGLLTLAGSATIAGTVSGAGTLALAGTETLATGAVLNVSHLLQSSGAVTVAKNLTYNGSFVQTAGPIRVMGDTLVLNGADALTNGAISGAGFLATYGAVSLVNYTVNAGAVWQVYGATTASSSVTLGDAGGGSGRLAIETDGRYDITGNGGIVVAPGGSGTVGNFAVFEKTGGTGVSTVAAAFTNSGLIVVTSGALDLAAAVSGTGSATIGSAGVLRFDSTVASTQTIAFAGTTGGRLALNDPSGVGLGFGGVVKGFGGKDQLDLTTFAFSGNPTIGWSQTTSGSGILTVTDGSKTAKIKLFGQYAHAGFGKAQDGGSGTDITYSTPPQVVALATPHHG